MLRESKVPTREENVSRESKVPTREDFSTTMEYKRRTLQPYAQAARNKGMKASLKDDRLIIDGEIYTVHDQKELAEKVSPRDIFERKVEENHMHLFFGRLSPFSNLHTANFTVCGQQFNSSEQFYMYEKAKYSNDLSAATKILNAQSGLEAKLEGSKIQGNEKLWYQDKAKHVMKLAIMEKFRQNPSLLSALMATQGYTLAECNPGDKYWGIGLHLTAHEANDMIQWQGFNHLGAILMDVRQELTE